MGVDLNSYDYIIVAYSGGKDSTACVLHLLEAGAPKERMMLWHHDVDGREGSTFMDWPVTRDYCRKFSEAIGIPLYFSWRQGGFERELLKENSKLAPICFEALDGTLRTIECDGKVATRRKFPAPVMNLMIRWCTPTLKIELASRALTNQKEFLGKRTLFVTGERAEESSAWKKHGKATGRAAYAEFEPHRCHREKLVKRHVDHYRPVKMWPEKEVWAIMERWHIRPHPCYELGWGRCSCAGCVFGNENQWASLKVVAPEQYTKIAAYEKEFGVKIQMPKKRKGWKVARAEDLEEMVALGRPYEAATPERAAVVNSSVYPFPIITQEWQLPAGAYGESAGPV